MEITVGIDVSKKRLDVYVHPSGVMLSLDNDEASLIGLVEQLGALKPDCIGMEATGGYEKLAAACLADAGLPVVVINPAQVRHYARAVVHAPRPTPSTPASSPCSWPPQSRCRIGSRMKTQRCWPS